MSDKFKKRKTYDVRLTKFDLIHLRDLFSVTLPPEMKETLSQRLAQSQERVLVEAKLWQKIAKVCQEAEIPLNDDAPDFVVAASTSPAISVFELAHEPAQGDESEENELFEEDEEEEGTE